MQAFNRTIKELKLWCARIVSVRANTFNRTIKELKHAYLEADAAGMIDF